MVFIDFKLLDLSLYCGVDYIIFNLNEFKFVGGLMDFE